jgi:hypothetical protein
MTPFGAYRCYLAFKSHFTTDSYDIVKYRGRVSAKLETFEKRKDRYRFEKLAKNKSDKEIVETFVANFTSKPDYSGLYDDQTDTRYQKWLGYQQALSYNFGNEIKNVFEDVKKSGLCYNDVFFGTGQHPPVLTAYLGKQISVDTFAILDRLNSFTEQMGDDIVTRDILRVARKYDPFLKVDMDVYGNITERVREQVFG